MNNRTLTKSTKYTKHLEIQSLHPPLTSVNQAKKQSRTSVSKSLIMTFAHLANLYSVITSYLYLSHICIYYNP